MGSSVLARIQTARAIGLANIARVLSYRLRLRAGLHPVQRILRAVTPEGPFFAAVEAPRSLPVPTAWRTTANYFGWYRPPLGDQVPDWHRNPFTGAQASNTGADWWTIPDFDPTQGDVKAIWEASRFDWAVNMAQQAREGVPDASDRLNQWLTHWSNANPPFKGRNWKCAQEASIRVMHLAAAGLILGETEAPRPPLVALLVTHLRRIAPTVAYAKAQDNNHATSEAAALFIGGSWLARLGLAEGEQMERQGRRLLAGSVLHLIEADGGFSQYSVTYHRLMLETLCLAEVWRGHLGLPAFSEPSLVRLASATDWLRAVVDPVSGDAPNLGANDGANLLPLTDADYRDFRPTVQLATTLFKPQVAYPEGPWGAQLAWLGVPSPPVAPVGPRPRSVVFDQSGLAVLERGTARAILRYPRFRFRPSHADALHVDLWVAGHNLLRDGGSFSYADLTWLDYFAGARGHNTVQFDDREQMPRLGRFLWGSWLTARTVAPIRETTDSVSFGASYRDRQGAVHSRTLDLREGSLTVTDLVRGFKSKAVLRWRLQPGEWTQDGTAVTMAGHQLAVSADVSIKSSQLVTGWESRYYHQKAEIPILEVELADPGTVTSCYRWPP